MHPWVSYHLSFLQVHCHMMTHPSQSNGNSTKETKFCCFCGPHASMCHTSVWLCTQLRTIGYLCSFHKGHKWPTSGQSGYLSPAASGIPTASERGATSEVAHKWANWLPHPCCIGDPSGGQNQKWPTSGHIGYLTPAVSGIPTAPARGAKSEVAHKWANWLPHPCRIGDPRRFRAGGKIRSGPQVGKLATSPLLYRGSPLLQRGGQNQKWPTSGQIGYLTPAASGIPAASERGAKSEVAHKWANWLPHPCRIGDPRRSSAGGKIRSGPQVGKLATSPLPHRGSPPLQSGGQNQKWPTSGQSGYLTPAVSGIPAASERGAKSEVAHKWANWLPHPCRIGIPSGGQNQKWPTSGQIGTSPLLYRGSPPLERGGQNQKWPTSGQIGYLTPAVSGISAASERGAKSEVAHKWANWLPHPCRIGDPRRFRAGGKIRSGPQVGKLATSPLPHRGSPPLQSGGQNQKWPTSGQIDYLTPAVSGIPTASERGAKSEVAHEWAKWLPHPCCIGDPRRFTAGGKIRSDPQVGKLATSPLPYRGSPAASEQGAKSEVAHKWAKWLPHPCRIGNPRRFRAGGKIRSGPQVGKLATSHLPYRGSPPVQSGWQNQKWPSSGQIGYLTPAVSGIPAASEQRAKSEVAHRWANRVPHPCCIGDPRSSSAGGKIRNGPQVCKLATSPLPYRGSPLLQSGGQNQKWPTSGQSGYSPMPYRGSPPLQSGGQNQKWPTSGQIGYLTPAVSGIPAASQRGAKSEVTHKWANWLPHPCRIGDPQPLQSGGQNQKWPTSGQSGYLTPAVSGIPAPPARGAKSEVAHKWANWLPHPCRIGDPRRFKAGGKIRSGPQVGKLATSPLPYRGSPAASERGAKSEVAHKWAKWLPHPCCIGDPRPSSAGGKIRSGPQVGKLATSPLSYRGSPPLHSGGQNQK